MRVPTIIKAGLFAGSLVAGFLGCGGSDDESVTTTATSATTDEEVYLASLEMEGAFPDISNDVLIETGRGACQALDEGLPYAMIVAIAVDQPNITERRADEIGYLIGAAVATFCPEHARQIPA